MNCREVTEIIQLYLDSELDARSTLNVLRHLECCPGCSRLLDRDLEQKAMLRHAARSEAIDSQRLRQQIVRAIRRKAARSRYQWFWLEFWRHIEVFVAAVAASVYRR